MSLGGRTPTVRPIDLAKKVQEIFDKAFLEHNQGDRVTYLVAPGVIQSPQGPQTIFSITVWMDSTIIGQKIAATGMVPANPGILEQPEEAGKFVSGLLEQIRQARSQALTEAQSQVNDTSTPVPQDGGLTLP